MLNAHLFTLFVVEIPVIISRSESDFLDGRQARKQLHLVPKHVLDRKRAFQEYV